VRESLALRKLKMPEWYEMRHFFQTKIRLGLPVGYATTAFSATRKSVFSVARWIRKLRNTLATMVQLS